VDLEKQGHNKGKEDVDWADADVEQENQKAEDERQTCDDVLHVGLAHCRISHRYNDLPTTNLSSLLLPQLSQ